MPKIGAMVELNGVGASTAAAAPNRILCSRQLITPQNLNGRHEPSADTRWNAGNSRPTAELPSADCDRNVAAWKTNATLGRSTLRAKFLYLWKS